MYHTYTAKYTKIASGYMGQLVEWPEVVTEGKSLEDCRAMLQDALQEMVLVSPFYSIHFPNQRT
jgi:predicted RNase H-like HicB family nuclease